MENLENAVREYLKNGGTPESLADDMTKAMHKVQGEQEEKNMTEKDSWLTQVEEALTERVKAGEINSKDVAAAATLVLQTDTWTAKDCDEFYTMAVDFINLLDNVINHSDEVTDQIIEALLGKSKSNSDKKASSSSTDEAIKSWLKNL